MQLSTVQPLNPSTWLVAPALSCALASVLLALPIRIFGLGLPEPVFAMAPAFAWGLIRPSVLPPFVLVALGLFQDGLWGGALGLWPLCLLSLYGGAFFMRRILNGQDFWLLGAAYAAGCALAFGVGVLLTTVVAGVVPNLVGVGLQLAVTVVLFPLGWALIDRFEDADVRFR